MSKFQIVKGITDNLSETPYVEGKVYFTYDNAESTNLDIYADIDGTRRKIKEGVQREELNNYLLKTDIAAWAKEAAKPTYTASEVGALPNTTVITDEKVKQTPLNNSQDSRALLMGKDLGITETTSTAYVSGNLIWNDYLKTLSVYGGANGQNSYIKPGRLGYTSGSHSAEIKYPNSLLENYTYTLPAITGTIALTSDIPSISPWALATDKPSYTASEVGATTTSEVNSAIATAIGNINQFNVAIVSTLPTENIDDHTIYFMSNGGSDDSIYDEWMYINNDWEKIGTTAVDLSGYMQTSHPANGITSTDISNWNNKIDKQFMGYLDSTALYYPIGHSWGGSSNYKTWTFPFVLKTAGAYVNKNTPVRAINSTNNYTTLGTIYLDDQIQTGDVYLNYFKLYICTVNDGNTYIRTVTTLSDIPDTSSFLTSETDPVFSASAAAGITSTDISNWNAKVSDDKTWNGVTLNKTSGMGSSNIYVPYAISTDASRMNYWTASETPNNYAIAKYDSSAYLKSTTPSANDNSTKVATTAYVDAAIPDVSSFLTLADLPIYDGTVV